MKKIILLVLVLMTLTACGGGEEVQFANYSDQTPNPSELELLKIRVNALEKELEALTIQVNKPKSEEETVDVIDVIKVLQKEVGALSIQVDELKSGGETVDIITVLQQHETSIRNMRECQSSMKRSIDDLSQFGSTNNLLWVC